jgi:hypothetical protein
MTMPLSQVCVYQSSQMVSELALWQDRSRKHTTHLPLKRSAPWRCPTRHPEKCEVNWFEREVNKKKEERETPDTLFPDIPLWHPFSSSIGSL